MRSSIPAGDAEKLQILFQELTPLLWLTRNAIKVDEKTQEVGGEDLERFRKLEEKLVQVMGVIRSIAEQ